MEHTPLSDLFRLQDQQKKALAKLGIRTVRDLFYHFPVRYERSGDQTSIALATIGTDAILYGTIRKPEARRSWKTRRPMSEAWLEDGSGRIKLMWFNQPYMAKMFTDGMLVKVTGRVDGKGTPYVANPTIERIAALPMGGRDTVFGSVDMEETLFAIYPESVGISSRWFRHAVSRLIKDHVHAACTDPIPDEVRTRSRLPSLAQALLSIHTPEHERQTVAARKRFSFEEMFLLQVAKHVVRSEHDQRPTIPISNGLARTRTFIDRLPFPLTTGQTRAIENVMRDLATAPAMSRLLEGDVGSGKTAVAATTAYAVVTTAPAGRPSATLQVAYMAPTEILAEQHFASFIALFGHLPIHIGLLTGSGCKTYPSKLNPDAATQVSKAQLIRMVGRGEISILIGTHALIQQSVQFRDLAYVIIDEQHRFGTAQRMALTRKDGLTPHLLSMTATPIPRTLALTLFGDLDLTILDELPPGRKPVRTEVVAATGRQRMYEQVRTELRGGRQAYVICPRIDEPDPKQSLALQTRSVTMEVERLRLADLKGFRVGMLHGQMKAAEKETTMRAFLAHEIDVLVATSVIEVGVNVPNATIIIIEGAERFGLAQLHQLRGRVIRSTHQAYCFVLTSDGGPTTRLRALARAKNGFELAELDLKIRGPGELYGREQSELTDLGMEALKNLKLVEAAREEARQIVEQDPSLTEHPTLAMEVAARRTKLHVE